MMHFEPQHPIGLFETAQVTFKRLSTSFSGINNGAIHPFGRSLLCMH